MAHTKVTKNGTQNNGTANTFSYSGSFDVFKASEVQVTLDNIVLTLTTSTINESASPREYTVDYANKTVHIGGANLTSSDNVVIQPVTDMGAPTPRATYEPGASVTSADLNNNQLQLMRKAMEYNEQMLSSLGGTMTGNLHLGQNVDITFEGDNDNAYETTLTVADPTSDKTITFPDTTGTVVTTGDTGTVATGMIANDAINGDKIANDVINSEHYVAGSIDHEHLANDIIDGDNIQDDVINSEHIAADSLDSEHYAPNSVDADALAHTTVIAGSYTAADITVDAQGRITAAGSGMISGPEIVGDAIDGTKIADDSINSEHYVDGSINTAHIAAGQITSALMAANSVNTDAYVDDSITSDHYAPNSVDTTALAADGVTGAQIADDSVDSEHIVADSLDTEHYAPTSIDSAALASNAVTETKITDANVTEAKLAANSVTISKIGCEQTTISDSDSHIPTSGAVVDYVAAQIAPIGGLEVIADEDNFPTSQPASGVVISISDAAGIVVNGSGVSTTARTAGNGSDNVTINNFPSSLYSETLASGVGLMVTSTGSSNTYNYHKILAAETDVKQLSDDINDFNARYRVGSSNPSSALDSGDLFFNTGTGKLLVYNGTNSAWEEAQSIGNYYINTISSYSGTGGNSASFNGSAYRFVLSNAGTTAEQHIVSVNGVIQKPNSGTSQPSEGFAIDGSSIIFGAAPATGADYFIITIGSTVNIGTPSDGTVTAAKLTSGAVETAKIADGAVTEVKLGASNSPTNGYFLSAQSGNSGGLTWAQVTTDLVGDTSPQLGGNLDSNTRDIHLNNSGDVALRWQLSGTNKWSIFHNTSGSSNHLEIFDNNGNGSAAKFFTNGAVELYHDNSKKFETTSWGVLSGGYIKSEGSSGKFLLDDDGKFSAGDSNDLEIYHDGTDSYIKNTTGELILRDDTIKLKAVSTTDTYLTATDGGSVSLRYDNSVKFETTTAGATITGNLQCNNTLSCGSGLQSANVASFVGSVSNQVNIADGSNSSWGLLLSQSQGDSTSSGYHYTTNSGVSKPCAVINVQNDALHFGTNNTPRFRIEHDGHVIPSSNNSYDLGSSSFRWRNIYTNDLNLSNEGSSNDVDGSWGDWTIQEGESDLFLKNNRSGKKYKFNLTEVS